MNPWSFLCNPFIACSENSNPAMRKAGNYTVNALHRYPLDTFLSDRYAILFPLNKAFCDKFTESNAQQAAKLSGTASFKTLRKDLSGKKARKWDNTLQITYDKDSDKYLSFFPHNRIPFQSGTNLSRIDAVSTLALALEEETIPALVTLKTEVSAFDLLLKAAFAISDGDVSDKGNISDDLEDARIALGVEMYSTLGLMMDRYKTSTEKITNFFDLETIRNHQQVVFRSNIKPGELLQELTHTFSLEDEILFINRGNTILRVTVLDFVDAVPTWINKFVEIHPKSQQTIKATDIGNTDTCRFLKVMNMNDNTSGAFTIELL